MTSSKHWLFVVGLLLMAATANACPYCRLGSAGVVGAYDFAAPPDSTRDASSATTRPSEAANAAAPRSPSRAPEPPASVLPFGLSMSGGADVTNAYYHRGYLMGNHGVITQPFVTIFRPVVEDRRLSLTPYAGLWTDLQTDGTRNSGRNNGTATSGSAVATMFCCAVRPQGKSAGNSPWITPAQVPVPPGGSGLPLPGGPGAPTTTRAIPASGTSRDDGFSFYEADVSAGLALNFRPYFLDVRYTAYTYPNGALSGYQDVGAKLSVDLVPFFWRDLEPEASSFIFRPFVEVDRETNGLNRGAFTYIETGIEPSFQFPIGATRLGISLPATFGLSGAGFYTDARGSNEPLGYISAGLKMSMPLPIPADLGRWYLTGTVTYLHLDAYNLIVLNGRRQDQVIASLGLTFQL